MALRFVCKKCSFSIVLSSGGRYLACPWCYAELEVTEVPDRPKRPSDAGAAIEKPPEKHPEAKS